MHIKTYMKVSGLIISDLQSTKTHDPEAALPQLRKPDKKAGSCLGWETGIESHSRGNLNDLQRGRWHSNAAKSVVSTETARGDGHAILRQFGEVCSLWDIPQR